MTLEDMAREAGMHQDGDSWYCVGPGKYDDHDVSTEALTCFAALVRRQALEDAAKATEQMTWHTTFGRYALAEAADAIRALADKP